MRNCVQSIGKYFLNIFSRLSSGHMAKGDTCSEVVRTKQYSVVDTTNRIYSVVGAINQL